MDYPGNFEIPANPAGKSIAVSRFMAICTLVAFFLIIFLCGILLWSARSDRLEPFIISAENNTGQWVIVGRNNTPMEKTIEDTMQESVAGNFIKNFFKISINTLENENAWKSCDRNICLSDNLTFGDGSCSIYCSISDDLYSRFLYDIAPVYTTKSAAGEVWSVDEKTLIISNNGTVSENGGTWQAYFTVVSNINAKFDVRAFIKIARNKNLYPRTMGFYIADFNSYRVN